MTTAVVSEIFCESPDDQQEDNMCPEKSPSSSGSASDPMWDDEPSSTNEPHNHQNGSPVQNNLTFVFPTHSQPLKCIPIRNDLQQFSKDKRQNSVESSSTSSQCSSNDDSAANLDSLCPLSACSSPSRSLPTSPCGPRFKLIHEGDIHVCRLNHTRTVISKIMGSKFLRRWENHHLYLSSTEIHSRTPSGFMEEPVPFVQIEDVYVVSRWDASQKYCIRIVIPDGSVLLQVHNAYARDQWLHSILWKRSMLKYHKLLVHTRRPEILLKELKCLVDLVVMTPLQEEYIYQTPLQVSSEVLQSSQSWLPKILREEVISIIVPLLEKTSPTAEMCDFFCMHCHENPRSATVTDLFTPVVQRILKHNMDFGKCPKIRVFVQDYIQCLNCQNSGPEVLRIFVSSIHGPSSTCPHPRVLPNLVSICLAAMFSIFEERRNYAEEINDKSKDWVDWESRHDCFLSIFEIISEFEDWRPMLAQLLQPIPFPDDALAYGRFTLKFKPIIKNISADPRCDVHLMVLGIRDGKEGWFHLYCPLGIACDDEGELWSCILKSLVGCCCKRKRFLSTLNKCLGPLMLRALRDDETCQHVLCAMLELEVVENNDMQLQIITTLQTTDTGNQHYNALCQWQLHLRELQQKGGPRKLTLPSRSTDADLAKLLSCGSFGNLECLSLAFTQVTSACADQLIKLPSLRYLNLWSTQFGDNGLQLISEHLHRLQVLNLCETPVTDKGLIWLSSMKNLRKLNLNSTSLSAHTFEGLKQKLPSLQECDIRYTDAW